MPLYAADGSINVTVVDGTTNVGAYAPNGSWNVVVAPTPVVRPIGINHPCGAKWVTSSVSDSNYYAPDGSMNVTTSGSPKGPTKVTVVSGAL